MRTKTINIYQFSELSQEAQDRAIDGFRSSPDLWGWGEEWWESAQAFSRIAPISIETADYDRGHAGIRWTAESNIAELSGLRAWKWLENNGWFSWAEKEKTGACTMTGFCGDCAFGDAITEYARTPSRVPDLEQVFYESAQAWVIDARADMEACYSDESIKDMIGANEYEFNADGTLV